MSCYRSKRKVWKSSISLNWLRKFSIFSMASLSCCTVQPFGHLSPHIQHGPRWLRVKRAFKDIFRKKPQRSSQYFFKDRFGLFSKPAASKDFVVQLRPFTFLFDLCRKPIDRNSESQDKKQNKRPFKSFTKPNKPPVKAAHFQYPFSPSA